MLKKNYQRKLGTRVVTNAPAGMKKGKITNRQQAKMRGYEGLNEWLLKPEVITVYTGNAPFVAAVGVFQLAYKKNKDLAPLTHTDNSGFSGSAGTAINAMAKKAAALSGFAQVKLELDGNHDEAEKFHVFETFYTEGAMSLCIKNGKDARKLLDDNMASLTGYVAATDLTDPGGLDDLIAACENAVGSDVSVHELEPIDTDNFKKSFPPVDKSMRTLNLLSRFDVGFHTQVLKLTGVPTVAVQHTVVFITLKNKVTKAVIEGAEGTLSVSTETETSDYQGIMVFEQVRNGKDIVLKITAANYADVVMHIGIAQGQDNHFDIEMEPNANPS